MARQPAGRARGGAYRPTENDLKMVTSLAAIGTDQEDIAKLLRISAKTLRKHFREVLDIGMLRANAAVGGALYKAATTPGPGQNTAMIFWAKCRMGWREQPQQHEHSGPDGKTIEIRQITRIIVDPRAPDPAPKTDKKAEA